MEYYNKLVALRKQKYDRFLELQKIYNENGGELPIELQGEGERIVLNVYWLDICIKEYEDVIKKKG